MTIQLQSLTLGQPTTLYPSVTEEHLSAETKQVLITDWIFFILSGFTWPTFTPNLYRFLHGYCQYSAQDSPETFWVFWFKNPQHFRAFLNQFGGNKMSAERGMYDWFHSRAARDLKQAMCEEMGQVYGAIIQVLTDLENNHNSLASAWSTFAQNAGLAVTPYPAFVIGENAQTMIAYAVDIAIKTAAAPPLRGLQLIFPEMAKPAANGAPVVLQPLKGK
jgi:hypothetical protein